jgi:acid stress-induced BolA-like protein IbaG/YrbA
VASIEDQLKTAVEAAIDGADVQVSGAGGHFEIRVVSQAFAGKNTLQKHRMVLGAIKHLMGGDDAPVHAIDKLETLTE